MLKYQDIKAPVACPAGTVQEDQCVQKYMDQQSAWCCLVPQLYNARRFGLDVSAWPTIARVEKTCLALPAFDLARPERQPDAPQA